MRGFLAGWINRGTTGATGLEMSSLSAFTCSNVKCHRLLIICQAMMLSAVTRRDTDRSNPRFCNPTPDSVSVSEVVDKPTSKRRCSTELWSRKKFV